MASGTVSLSELKRKFPKEWEEAMVEVSRLMAEASSESIANFIKNMAEIVQEQQSQVELGKKKGMQSSQYIKARISILLLNSGLKQNLMAGRAGTKELRPIDNFISQKLLFDRKNRRRQPSVRWFRFWWQFVKGKDQILATIQSMGIYCIYSRELLIALKKLVNGRTCLEIGAGDGTLSLFLAERGVVIHASDDQSWSHRIKYPDWVEKRDAISALMAHQPRVVICSWPPANNSFEKEIFKQDCVELYIVIGSKHHYASGNFHSYHEQKNFHLREDSYLSKLVLPFELDNSVLVFERKSEAS